MNDISKLIEKAKNNDEKAFNELYGKTYPELYRYCKKLCRNSSDAKDLMQEVYFSAWKKINNYTDINFSAWLNSIAHNLWLNMLRDRKDELYSEDDFIEISDDAAFTPENRCERSIRNEKLMELINTMLSENQKKVILMYYYDEKSVGEIAAELHCSESTVKTRLRLARKKLYNKMRKDKNSYTLSLPSVFRFKPLSIESKCLACIASTAIFVGTAAVFYIKPFDSRTVDISEAVFRYDTENFDVEEMPPIYKSIANFKAEYQQSIEKSRKCITEFQRLQEDMIYEKGGGTYINYNDSDILVFKAPNERYYLSRCFFESYSDLSEFLNCYNAKTIDGLDYITLDGIDYEYFAVPAPSNESYGKFEYKMYTNRTSTIYSLNSFKDMLINSINGDETFYSFTEKCREYFESDDYISAYGLKKYNELREEYPELNSDTVMEFFVEKESYNLIAEFYHQNSEKIQGGFPKTLDDAINNKKDIFKNPYLIHEYYEKSKNLIGGNLYEKNI